MSEEAAEEESLEAPPAQVDLGALMEDPVIGMLASGGAFLTGVALLADDAGDFGELSTPEHPSPFHHWIWGAGMMMVGIAGMGFNLLRLIQENPPPPRLPKSLVEGMPRRQLETFR